MPITDLEPLPLPAGIRTRIVPGVNGLAMHVLEAGYETPNRPLLLLLHGFPELAFSWRKVMLPLAEAGFHVVAPDQRGYGRTTGWKPDYDQDLRPWWILSIARDALALVHALGYDEVAAVIGHDFGSPAAAHCALVRSDVFRSVVLMSAPYAGPPPLGAHFDPAPALAELATLDRPRKHYQWYYSTREADAEMLHARQGLHAFLRAYYHVKSADWPQNRPFPLAAWTADELAKLPDYYLMPHELGMADTVVPFMPTAAQVAACRWLPDAELAVYAREFARTGFQGGLNWYRCATDPVFGAMLGIFGGRTIDVPSMYVAGAADWGIHQNPGAFERMRAGTCTKMLDCHLIPGAGHWVQQEQPEVVAGLLYEFVRKAGG